jgi:glycine dehydrogenase subunit 1
VALAFTINLCLLGPRGLAELARLCHARACYAREQVLRLPGFSPRFDAPMFSELAVRVPGGDARRTIDRAVERGVVPGVDLGRWDAAEAGTLLISVSEQHRRQDIDRLVRTLEEVSR